MNEECKIVIDYQDMEESKLEILYKFLKDMHYEKEASEVKELIDDCLFYGASN